MTERESWQYGHRVAWYEFLVLNRYDQIRGPLLTVEGGSITLSESTRLQASGSLVLRDMGTESWVDWHSDRVKIIYHMKDEFGEKSWPLGVFMFATPRREYFADGSGWTVELISKLAIMDEDQCSYTYSLDKGVNPAEIAYNLSSPVSSVAYTPASNRILGEPKMWEPGTSYLKIVNDLLKMVNYRPLTVNANGQYVIGPYQEPNKRAVVFDFMEGGNAIHEAKWTRDEDLSKVPNRVILVSKGTKKQKSMIAVATNYNDYSPYSVARRGRTIALTEKNVEADSQKTLDELAIRRLAELTATTASLDIKHLPVDLWPGDAVTFNSQEHRVKCVVDSVKYDLSPQSLCSTRLREAVHLL